MADNKADKTTSSNPKPATASSNKASDFKLETDKANAETTVAREQTDQRGAAENAVATQNDPRNDEVATGVLGVGHGDTNATHATVSQLQDVQLSEDAQRERERIDALPEVPMYNPNAGLAPRVGGPYLDNLELERAEVQRAVFENREPDFSNMAGTAGVTLVTAGQLAAAHTASNTTALAQFIEAHSDDDKLGPAPITTVPMAGTNLDVIEVAELEKKAREDWDNKKVTSHDDPEIVFTESATRDATRE